MLFQLYTFPNTYLFSYNKLCLRQTIINLPLVGALKSIHLYFYTMQYLKNKLKENEQYFRVFFIVSLILNLSKMVLRVDKFIYRNGL